MECSVAEESPARLRCPAARRTGEAMTDACAGSSEFHAKPATKSLDRRKAAWASMALSRPLAPARTRTPTRPPMEAVVESSIAKASSVTSPTGARRADQELLLRRAAAVTYACRRKGTIQRRASIVTGS